MAFYVRRRLKCPASGENGNWRHTMLRVKAKGYSLPARRVFAVDTLPNEVK
ncbi:MULTISPECIES: hypothetical protein [Brevibacillus]|uniref:hypothetical protein n=1 Tax=Brevibacillus TaxID=55080 RepID=UPI0038783151